MILKQLYNDFAEKLSVIYDKSEAAYIRDIIFEWAADISRSVVMAFPEKQPEPLQEQKIQSALEKLLTHEPVQYITGEAWFYKLKFIVSPAVLIPRPETEELVEEVISFLKNRETPSVIDIGTGSGCIPVSVKKNYPSAEVSAIDISNAAIAIANKNALLHETPVHFFEKDFLHEQSWNDLGMFDAIISNPPYIPEKESSEMDKHVTGFEPHMALFVPDDRPFIFYEKIAVFAKAHLKENGKIFMETHEAYANEVAAIFSETGFTAVVKKDISGKERMVLATRSL